MMLILSLRPTLRYYFLSMSFDLLNEVFFRPKYLYLGRIRL
ncbi:MAG: hypothetical protein ACTS41_00995 [Candidatus Hodgkinia cicadicola]